MFSYSLPLAVLLSSTSSAVPLQQGLQWRNCTDNDPPRVSCAELKVPIDYNDPSSGQITLVMARIAAQNSTSKIGSLIFNPGGPAISAVDLFLDVGSLETQYNASLFPDEFDVIGPDPRGVGHSHPLSCDPAILNQRVSYQPEDEEFFQQLVAHNQALGASCLNLTGPMLGHMDSISVAKDFDVIRAALGEDKISYFGISYGTMIGQAYARLFPDRIRAMALDSVIDHSLTPVSTLAIEVYSYENEFVRFAAWCAANSTCPLHGTDVQPFFQNLNAQADKYPVPAPGCVQSSTCRSNVTGEEMRFNLQGMLVFQNPLEGMPGTGWASAAKALKQAAAGNATLISTPTAQTANQSSTMIGGLGQMCLDYNHTADSLVALKNLKQMSLTFAPNTQGAGLQFHLEGGCLDWPTAVQNPSETVNITGTPPILLTNGFYDPDTPYVMATGLQSQIQNSVLAARNGDGHTSYYLFGQTYHAINEYLVTLKTPPPNTIFES